MALQLQLYSDKCVVLRGDTKPCKDKISSIGGKYNSNLAGEPGWIFPRGKEAVVRATFPELPAGYTESYGRKLSNTSGSVSFTPKPTFAATAFTAPVSAVGTNVVEVTAETDLVSGPVYYQPRQRGTLRGKVVDEEDQKDSDESKEQKEATPNLPDQITLFTAMHQRLEELAHKIKILEKSNQELTDKMEALEQQNRDLSKKVENLTTSASQT